MKPLQKILREKMPTTRRGMETSHKNACADVNVLLGNYVYNAKLISLESFWKIFRGISCKYMIIHIVQTVHYC